MTQLYSDLQTQSFAVTGLDGATYPAIWTKWIDSVNLEKKTGFCFGGDFFSNEPQDLDTAKPRLILLAASTNKAEYYLPSARGRKSDFKRIYEEHHVLLFANGQIEPTGLHTSDPRAWALQLRDQVSLWLHRINETFGAATELQAAWDHLTMRLIDVRHGEPVTWTAEDVTALTALMVALEKCEGQHV